MSLSLSHWYLGSGVMIVLIPDLCPFSYFHCLPKDPFRGFLSSKGFWSSKVPVSLSLFYLVCIVVQLEMVHQ